MTAPMRPQRPRPGDDAGGPGSAWGPSLGLLAVALGLVAGGLFWWWSSSGAPSESYASAASPAGASAAPGPVATPPQAASAPGSTALPAGAAQPAARAADAGPRIWRQRDPNGDQTPDLADYVNEGERPTMAEVIARLHQAGVYTGLGAFQPPGTRPPLVGLAVPEDYALPAGYVRHYQATDDGQRIEAILMYSPDQPPLGANGQPLAVPADRVVPAEAAPPGLPLRRIVVPAPVDPSRGAL